MSRFKIPTVPPTTNKTIRFPNDLINKVENAICGKTVLFRHLLLLLSKPLSKTSRKNKSSNLIKSVLAVCLPHIKTVAKNKSSLRKKSEGAIFITL